MKIKFLILLILTIPFNVLAKNKTQYNITPTPDWVSPQKYKLTKKNNKGSIHYALVDYQYKVNKENTVLYSNIVKLPLNNNGVDDVANVNITFNPSFESLNFHTLQVKRNGVAKEHLGKVDIKVFQKEDELDSGLYSENYQAVIFLEDIRTGDEITISYSLEGKNPAFGEYFSDISSLNWSIYVDQFHLRYLVNKNMPFEYKSTQNNFKFKKTSKGEYNDYSYNAYNIEAIKQEDNTPKWHKIYNEVSVTSYKSWQELIAWGNTLFEKNIQTTDKIKLFAQKIQKEHPLKKDQIIAATNFVQDEIRYLGLELGERAYIPYPPELTLERRFGDCKDKTTLLIAILQALDVKAFPVLVHSKRGKTLPSELPSPLLFNHAIVKIIHNGKPYWIDATAANQGELLISDDTVNYYHGITLLDKGISNYEKISVTHNYSAEHLETYDLSNGLKKPVKFTVESTYFGQQASQERNRFKNSSLSKISDNYLKFYSRYYSNIESTENIQLQDNRKLNQFNVIEKYTIEDIWEKDEDSDNENAIAIDFTPALIYSALYYKKSSKRSRPFSIYPSKTKQTIVIKLPETWNVEKADTLIESDEFKYTSKVRYDRLKKEIHINYEIEYFKDHVSPENYKNYQEKTKKVINDLGYFLTYNK